MVSEKLETRTCKACKQELHVSNFYFRKEKNDYRSCCKKCKRVNSKEDIIKRVNAETKICKHCNEKKPISEYQRAGGGKWAQPYCKPCDKARKKKHWDDNREYCVLKSKNYYEENKDTILSKDKQERLAKRPETLKRIRSLIDERKMSPEEKKRRKSECDRLYRIKNKEKVLENKRKYRESGRSAQLAKEWQARRMNNIEFRIKKNLRGRIYVALKRGIKSESTMKLLGCSIEFFKSYFESKFTEGMSWDIYMEGGIHIDHIFACKHFELTDPEQQRKCFHYTNLQPLWQVDNLIKGSKKIQPL